MPDIILATLNARFIHSAFGLRYLLANMGDLSQQTALREFTLGIRERDVVEQILAEQPKIVGLSVYIWNVAALTNVARILKAVAPGITLVLGGPEVSHEWDDAPIVETADYLIKGEGDLAFAQLCRDILNDAAPEGKVIDGGLPSLPDLASPYPHYSDFDLQHGRLVYVEASRGCPFRCHFCLSSLDRSVRALPLAPFLEQMQSLLERGVRQWKFVDRTFNLKAETAEQILRFFLDRYQDGMFLHFEMIPDRLPESLRPLIAAFPPGALQFEIGIQSFNPDVCARIGRRQNFLALEDNFRFLAEETGVHVHADLIAGLPGEDLASFAQGFDKLRKLRPAEIQVGILKRLKGTPITAAGPEWEMTYATEAPYEILRTSHLTFGELQRLQRFARFWDLVANSGRFPEQLPILLGEEAPGEEVPVEGHSAFGNFMAFADWIYDKLGVTSGIALSRLETLLKEYLGQRPGLPSGLPIAVLSNLPKRQRRRAELAV